MSRYRSKYAFPSRDSDSYSKCRSRSGKGSWCTLPAGHDGPQHEVFRAGKIVETWSDE